MLEGDQLPTEICLLPYGRLCLTYIDSLKIYDQYIYLIKTVEKINNKDIAPNGIAFNKRNELYISDLNKHCFYMMDFNLN